MLEEVCKDHTNETGFYLREVNYVEEDKSQIFSTHWDYNDTERIFLCHQNGKFQILKNGTNHFFNIFLEPFSVEFTNEEKSSKMISVHWDKFTTIPGKIDEIIFVLGISKTVYYTTIPASDDAERFRYGSSVIDIYQHSSRIISLSVNHDGNILATGDEEGHISVQILRLQSEPIKGYDLLESFERSMKGSFDISTLKSDATSLVSLYEDPSKHRCIIHIPAKREEQKPIFSLVWLPNAIVTYSKVGDSKQDDVKQYSYILTSGSCEGLVRLWRVTINNGSAHRSSEICISPLLNLNTISTHILSLNVTSTLMSEVGTFSHHSLESSRSYPSHSDSKNQSYGSKSNLTSTSKTSSVDKSSIVYCLVGGTSNGQVYIWKIKYSDICSFCESDLLSSTVDNQLLIRSNLMRDSLCALLQVSARPIIQTTLTLCPSAMKFSSTDESRSIPPLLLAASDSQGILAVFAEKETGLISQESLFITSDTRELVPCVHTNFNTPVVSCIFRVLAHSLINGTMLDPLLSVSTYDGDIYNYSSLFLFQKLYDNFHSPLSSSVYEEPILKHLKSTEYWGDTKKSNPNTMQPAPNLSVTKDLMTSSAHENLVSVQSSLEISPRILPAPKPINIPKVTEIKSNLYGFSETPVHPDNEHEDVSNIPDNEESPRSVPPPVPTLSVPNINSNIIKTIGVADSNVHNKKEVRIITSAPNTDNVSAIDNRESSTRPKKVIKDDKNIVSVEKYIRDNKTQTIPVESTLGHAKINTTILLSEKLAELQKKLESDEMTVTTEVTTSTDKQLAARYVLNMQHYDNRYHQLTSFENLSHTPHKSFKSNMNKQVDKDWLLRRQEGGPSVDDLKILYRPEDPSCRINLVYSNNKLDQLTKRDSCRVQMITDPITLKQTFVTEIPFNNLFGNQSEEFYSWKNSIKDYDDRQYKHVLSML